MQKWWLQTDKLLAALSFMSWLANIVWMCCIFTVYTCIETSCTSHPEKVSRCETFDVGIQCSNCCAPVSELDELAAHLMDLRLLGPSPAHADFFGCII